MIIYIAQLTSVMFLDDRLDKNLQVQYPNRCWERIVDSSGRLGAHGGWLWLNIDQDVLPFMMVLLGKVVRNAATLKSRSL